MVRAQAGHQSFPGAHVGAGLSALVFLRLRDHVLAPAGKQREAAFGLEDREIIRLLNLTPRQILIVLHDLVATAAAITLTFVVRFQESALTQKIPGLVMFLPALLVYAAVVYFIFDLHRNKWRFTSVPDLYNIFRASTVLAVSLLALDYVLLAPNVYGTFFFGKITILLFWFLQMFLLGGSRT